MEFFAEILNGKFKNVIPIADGRYYVKIEKKNKRSLPQNSYYFGVVVPMVKEGLYEIGYDNITHKEQAHKFLSEKFLQQESVNKKTGEVIYITRSTTDLNTIEFNEYLEKCQKFGAEYLNIYIPSPNEQVELW
jgi:hypothetical protein